MELIKLILDQAGGVAIAILLIMRIESKLDGLTNAVVQLSEAIRPPHNWSRRYTTNVCIYAIWKFNEKVSGG